LSGGEIENPPASRVFDMVCIEDIVLMVWNNHATVTTFQRYSTNMEIGEFEATAREEFIVKYCLQH